ncbi:outer membrane protein [Aurantiacibacter spongiae]|uniref:outer membrane protein n=1 Tax=Aurantiacibacter spongiae TaxID=2488860 RepID=UPI00131545AF|nr:outer membrane beta-barrel protein [Aurantiacibacter spongiae]
MVAGALAALSTPTLAQDRTDQSGFRIEAIAGFDTVTTGVENTDEYDDSGKGFLYGAAAGYDVVVGGAVIGLDAEIAESSVDSGITYTDGMDVAAVALDASEDIFLGARVGANIGGTGLLYVKGGYSMANTELTARGIVDGERYDEKVDIDFEGFRVGGGFQVNFSRNLFGKVEYRYTSYGDASVEYDGVSEDVDEVFDYVNLERHQGVVGLGVRF